MSLVLDHVFVLCSPGAPEADRLISLGLREGSSNRHPGQGTANRRFFFADIALELLYISDAREARTGPGRELRLAERAAADGCPFGFVFRLQPGADVPFACWDYQPDYFPTGMIFKVGSCEGGVQEPLRIVMPPGVRKPTVELPPLEPFISVTKVGVDVPASAMSETLEGLNVVPKLRIRRAQSYCMGLHFERGETGQVADLRPDLPLTLNW